MNAAEAIARCTGSVSATVIEERVWYDADCVRHIETISIEEWSR